MKKNIENTALKGLPVSEKEYKEAKKAFLEEFEVHFIKLMYNKGEEEPDMEACKEAARMCGEGEWIADGVWAAFGDRDWETIHQAIEPEDTFFEEMMSYRNYNLKEYNFVYKSI